MHADRDRRSQTAVPAEFAGVDISAPCGSGMDNNDDYEIGGV